MRKIIYNSQRDNFTFEGKFKSWNQCFSTCAWMFISFYDKNIDATNDKQLAKYVDDVENNVGKPGIAEKIMEKLRWITGYTSMWYLVQQAGIQKYLPKKKIIFNEFFSIKNLHELVIKKPVIIGTSKLGGLKNGHIILLVDYDSKTDSFMVNDPFGDATGNYLYKNGDGVKYKKQWLNKYINYGNGCRVIYAE